jgi:hypothetical protein
MGKGARRNGCDFVALDRNSHVTLWSVDAVDQGDVLDVYVVSVRGCCRQ